MLIFVGAPIFFFEFVIYNQNIEVKGLLEDRAMDSSHVDSFINIDSFVIINEKLEVRLYMFIEEQETGL